MTTQEPDAFRERSRRTRSAPSAAAIAAVLLLIASATASGSSCWAEAPPTETAESSSGARASGSDPAPPEGAEVGSDSAPPESAPPPVPAAGRAPVAPPWQPVADRARIKSAIDRALNGLTARQREDGAYGSAFSDVGITALVLHAFAISPRAYREDDGPFISRAVDYLLANVQADGGIYNARQGLENYRTCMSLFALTTLDGGRKQPRYADVVARARDFVASLQCRRETKYDPQVHKRAFGGIGYGGDRRPDLSNTQFAIEALRAAGLSEDSEVFRDALTFLKRCQNTEQNDYLGEATGSHSTGDGGFMYAPGESKAPVVEDAEGTRAYTSYGGMTYAGVKSYVYAGLQRDDPLVRAAWQWIQSHYTVDENPGMSTPANPARGWQGLFYYYMVMARTLALLDERTVRTPDGVEHRWAADLAGKLISLQREDGSWENPVDRWWEGDPAVTTAYAVIALSLCYRELGTP